MCLDEDAGLDTFLRPRLRGLLCVHFGEPRGHCRWWKDRNRDIDGTFAIADQGCNFCAFLINVAIQSGKVRKSPEAGEALSERCVAFFRLSKMMQESKSTPVGVL